MKKILVILLSFFTLQKVMAQEKPKQPTLMVVPSDNWCVQNGFTNTFDNAGQQIKQCDYNKAFQENTELLLVVSKINTLFAARNFPLKDLKQSVSSISSIAFEDAAMNADRQNAGKSTMAESNLDRAKNIAKCDIIIELTWKVYTSGPNKYVTFILAGKDAYSNKQVAGAEGTSEPSMSAPLPVLLEEAVLKHIDNFQARLKAHFDDMLANGREIRLELKKWDSWTNNFETEYNGEEFGVLIEDWLAKNTVKGKFSTQQSTETKIVFEQVRIPLFNENGRPIDARAFGQQLKKFLKTSPFNLLVKTEAKGLGFAQVIVGTE